MYLITVNNLPSSPYLIINLVTHLKNVKRLPREAIKKPAKFLELSKIVMTPLGLYAGNKFGCLDYKVWTLGHQMFERMKSISDRILINQK